MDRFFSLLSGLTLGASSATQIDPLSAPYTGEALRVTCFFAATESPRLARLAAHTWSHLWRFSGHPNFGVGTLCSILDKPKDGVCVVLPSSLETIELQALRFSGRSCACDEVCPLLNPLCMECVLRNEPGRLASLDISELRVPIVFSGTYVYAFHYAAALGARDCLSALIERLGLDSPLLVKPGRILRSEMMQCCDASFPFGDRRGVLNLLLHHFSPAGFRPKSVTSLMESAACFGVDWLISFLYDVFGDAVEPGASLILASVMDHVDCCRVLIESGADLDREDGEEWTALMRASWKGHTDICRLLVEAGADLDLQGEEGMTALMYATCKDNVDAVRLLIEAGADVNVQEFLDGRTAVVYSDEKPWSTGDDWRECKRLLKEAGGVDLREQY